MVNIFADTIYQETETLSLVNNQDADNFPTLNFGTSSVDSTMGGFTYAETIFLNLTFTPAIQIENNTNSREFFKISSNPEFLLNNFNLIADVSFPLLGNGSVGFNSTESFSEFESIVTLDKYLDVPADFTDSVSFSGINLDSAADQTISVEYTATIVGRQP